MGDMSKPQFFQKYMVPLMAIVFSLAIVRNNILINLKTNNLVKHTSLVTDIYTKIERSISKNQYHLKIALAYFPEEFTLSQFYEWNFPDLQKKISIGDTITIYTANKWLSALCLQQQTNIYQIKKGSETLIDFSKTIEQKKSELPTFIIAVLILWPWYFIWGSIYKFRQSGSVSSSK